MATATKLSSKKSRSRRAHHLVWWKGKLVYVREGGALPDGLGCPLRILFYYPKTGLDLRGWYGRICWSPTRWSPEKGLIKFKSYPKAVEWVKRPLGKEPEKTSEA